MAKGEAETDRGIQKKVVGERERDKSRYKPEFWLSAAKTN